MTLKQIRDRLQPYNMAAVSELTGIEAKTLRRIKNGGGARYDTIEKLKKWLNEQAQ